MDQAKPEIIWERARTFLIWMIFPLVLGVLVAALIPQPVIGVINLYDPIYSYSAQNVIKQIDYARIHPEVRAVVLVLDSPGGTVVDTESVYLELLKLRKDKPVVVSINSMAASGAYYLTVGSDYVFAKPTSEVGNIGVIGYLPPSPTIYEGIISTGPYKLWGSPRDTYMREIEMIKQGFYGAVKAGRGDRLKAGPDVVLSGQIWPASAALQLGLIDELGTQSDAVEKAASLARVSNYKLADLYPLSGLRLDPSAAAGFFGVAPDGKSSSYPKEAGIYLLYIPPMLVEQK
jgi:protease IV